MRALVAFLSLLALATNVHGADRVEHLFLMVPAQQFVGQFLATFKEFPPSQKPGSFSIDAALEKLQQGSSR